MKPHAAAIASPAMMTGNDGTSVSSAPQTQTAMAPMIERAPPEARDRAPEPEHRDGAGEIGHEDRAEQRGRQIERRRREQEVHIGEQRDEIEQRAEADRVGREQAADCADGRASAAPDAASPSERTKLRSRGRIAATARPQAQVTAPRMRRSRCASRPCRRAGRRRTARRSRRSWSPPCRGR